MKKLSTLLIIGSFFTFFGFVGIFNFYVDPFWIWHNQPSWFSSTQGHNLSLDQKMRYTKPLQVIIQNPEEIFIGSSCIYRGIDATTIPKSYNFGISSLRIHEAYAYIQHCLRWLKPKRIILGLELWMFDSQKLFEAGFPSQITHPGYLIEAFGTSLLSWSTFKTSYNLLYSSNTLSQKDGLWNRSGFKTTYFRSQSDIIRVNNSFIKSYKNLSIKEKEIKIIYEIIKSIKEKDIELIIFISPLHKEMIDIIKKCNKLDLFKNWQQSIQILCYKHKIKFFDFSLSNPFQLESLKNGSSLHWIDSSHYSPVIGAWIMNQINQKDSNKTL